jgi:hypothetical protein
MCRSLPTQTRSQDDPVLGPSGADPSVGATPSRAAPLVVGGADGADMKVYPITTVTEDISTTLITICPAVGMAACVDNDLSCSTST